MTTSVNPRAATARPTSTDQSSTTGAPVNPIAQGLSLVDSIVDALRQTGAGEDTVTAAKLLGISGTMHRWASEALREETGADNGTVAFFAILDQLAERVAAGQPLQPLRDRLEQERAAEQHAEPGHFPWCKPGACITHADDDGETYIEHAGQETAITLSDGGYPEDSITITAGLGKDESFEVGTQVYVNVGDLDGLAFDPAGVDQLLTQFDTLTSALRAMRRQMDTERAQ